jgi:hypothetical protein
MFRSDHCVVLGGCESAGRRGAFLSGSIASLTGAYAKGKTAKRDLGSLGDLLVWSTRIHDPKQGDSLDAETIERFESLTEQSPCPESSRPESPKSQEFDSGDRRIVSSLCDAKTTVAGTAEK